MYFVTKQVLQSIHHYHVHLRVYCSCLIAVQHLLPVLSHILQYAVCATRLSFVGNVLHCFVTQKRDWFWHKSGSMCYSSSSIWVSRVSGYGRWGNESKVDGNISSNMFSSANARRVTDRDMLYVTAGSKGLMRSAAFIRQSGTYNSISVRQRLRALMTSLISWWYSIVYYTVIHLHH